MRSRTYPNKSFHDSVTSSFELFAAFDSLGAFGASFAFFAFRCLCQSAMKSYFGFTSPKDLHILAIMISVILIHQLLLYFLPFWTLLVVVTHFLIVTLLLVIFAEFDSSFGEGAVLASDFFAFAHFEWLLGCCGGNQLIWIRWKLRVACAGFLVLGLRGGVMNHGCLPWLCESEGLSSRVSTVRSIPFIHHMI